MQKQLHFCSSDLLCQPPEFGRQLSRIPTGKRYQVSQHIQVTGGCPSCFGTEKGSNQMTLQQATPYINNEAVCNLFHCSTSVFWFPNVYILFVALPWNVECSFITMDDFPWEFIVFVKFLIKDGPCKLSMCYILSSGGIAWNTCNL